MASVASFRIEEDEAKTFLECVANTPVDELHKNNIDESIHKFYRKCTKAAEVGCRLHFEETVGRNSNSIGNSSQTLGINNINIDKMADLKCWYCLAHLNKPTTLGNGITAVSYTHLTLPTTPYV